MSVVLPVRIGDPWVSIAAGTVVEILGREPWFPIPSGTREVPGVLVFRGRAVPVLDLAAVLATAPALSPAQVRPRTVIAAAGGSTIAIPVDEVRAAQDDPVGDGAARHVDLEGLVKALTAAALPDDGRDGAPSIRRPVC